MTRRLGPNSPPRPSTHQPAPRAYEKARDASRWTFLLKQGTVRPSILFIGFFVLDLSTGPVPKQRRGASLVSRPPVGVIRPLERSLEKAHPCSEDTQTALSQPTHHPAGSPLVF